MPPPRGLTQQLDQHLHKCSLLPRRANLLLAVSGGADSIALLRLLHTINHSNHWQWQLIIAHIDHGIRGKASAADARFVQSLAKQLHLPFTQRKIHLPKSASEAAARTARLRALAAIAKQKKSHAILLAHHADDQAETVLLRLLRGTGLDGLSAMSPSTTLLNTPFLRPLLHVRRAALRAYLEQINQPWREDETNATDAYLRNRIRAQLLPTIESLAPAGVEALTRIAQLAAEAQQVIESRVRELLTESLIRESKKQITLRRAPLQHTEPLICGELIRTLVVLVGGSTESADFERTREAVRMIQASAGGKSIQMGRDVIVRAGSGTVIVEAKR